MGCIYALKDEHGVIRYVGKSTRDFNNIHKRLSEHLLEAKNEMHKRARWIRSMQSKGIEIACSCLAQADEDQLDTLERYWIAKIRLAIGDKLTNGTDGGDGGRLSPEAQARRTATFRKGFADGRLHGPMKGAKHTPETKKKMSAAAKARIARGDSHLCSIDHQRRAGKSSRANDTPEARKKNVERLRAIAILGAKARWG